MTNEGEVVVNPIKKKQTGFKLSLEKFKEDAKERLASIKNQQIPQDSPQSDREQLIKLRAEFTEEFKKPSTHQPQKKELPVDSEDEETRRKSIQQEVIKSYKETRSKEMSEDTTPDAQFKTNKLKEVSKPLSDKEQRKALRESILNAFTPVPQQEEAIQQTPAIPKSEKMLEEFINKEIEKRKNASSKEMIDKNERLKKLEVFRNELEECKNFHYKPGAERRYWQAHWKYYGSKVGLTITVPECDRTLEEKKELEKKGRMLIYVPEQLTKADSLDLISKMYPRLVLDAEKRKNIISKKIASGWIDVDAMPDAPLRLTTQDEQLKQLENEGRIGMNLPIYIITIQKNFDLCKKNLDENTWTRLPASTKDGLIIATGLERGTLRIISPYPSTKEAVLGVRSIGIKRD